MTTLTRALLVVLLVVVGACSSSAGASAPPPTGSGPAAATAASGSAGSGPVTTPEAAAQRVIALDQRFATIGPKNPDLIGGCCFYEATTTADGFLVKVELGWGDCPSGCISHHRWSFAVGRDGTTTLLSETGDPVPSGFPAGGDTTY